MLAADQRNCAPTPELVAPFRMLLIARKQAVQFFDVARRELATARYEREQAFDRVLLVTD